MTESQAAEAIFAHPLLADGRNSLVAIFDA